MEFLSNFVSCIGGNSDFNSSKYLRRRDQSLKKHAKNSIARTALLSLSAAAPLPASTREPKKCSKTARRALTLCDRRRSGPPTEQFQINHREFTHIHRSNAGKRTVTTKNGGNMHEKHTCSASGSGRGIAIRVMRAIYFDLNVYMLNSIAAAVTITATGHLLHINYHKIIP